MTLDRTRLPARHRFAPRFLSHSAALGLLGIFGFSSALATCALPPRSPRVVTSGPDVIFVVSASIKSDNFSGEVPTVVRAVGLEGSTITWNPAAISATGLGLDGAGTASISGNLTGSGGTLSGSTDAVLDLMPLGLNDLLEFGATVDVYVRGCAQPFSLSQSGSGSGSVVHAGCASVTGPFGNIQWDAQSVSPGCANGAVPINESVSLSGISSTTTRAFAEAPGVPYSLATSRTLFGHVDETGGPHFFGSHRITVGLHSTFSVTVTLGGDGRCLNCDGFVSVSKHPVIGSVDWLGAAIAQQPVDIDINFTNKCPCCEYRQYLLGAIYQYDVPTFLGPSLPLFSTVAEREDTGAPARSGPCSHTSKYGYRAGGDCPGDQYISPDRSSGCVYHGRDNVTWGAPVGFHTRMIAFFSGRIRHNANAQAGCTESFEEEKARWTVCLDISPLGTITDCSSSAPAGPTKALNREATSFQTLGCSSPMVPAWSYEHALGACLYLVGDTLILAVSARTDSADTDSLVGRGARLQAALGGLPGIPGLPPSRFLASAGAEWGKVFYYAAPHPLPDSMAVQLTGLEQPVRLMLPARAGLVGVPPPSENEALRIRPESNPARAEIRFSLSTAAVQRADIAVFDLSGRRVRTLYDGSLEPGTHPYHWDGRHTSGALAPAGIYMIRVEADRAARTEKIAMIR